MKYFIDTKEQTLTVESGTSPPVTQYLYTEAAFETLSHQWMRVGWSLGYYSAFTWMGRPILQLPQDLIHLQEIICLLRPDVVIETGVYQGGSLLYHATLCQALAQGRIIGIDISIPPGIRTALQEHPLGGRIGLIEGSSTSPTVVEAVKALLRPGEKVMVVLDSAHTCEHVRGELELYSSFVTPGSYLVVADGIMRE